MPVLSDYTVPLHNSVQLSAALLHSVLETGVNKAQHNVFSLLFPIVCLLSAPLSQAFSNSLSFTTCKIIHYNWAHPAPTRTYLPPLFSCHP